jgi:16S rRNA G966 N2-methylase RsmD
MQNINKRTTDIHLSKVATGMTLEKVDKNFIVPSHRKTKRFQTIEEYKEKLNDTKWSYNEFINQGYCRDQLICFNFILNGRLSLTHDKFVEEYCINLRPLREIEKKYGIPYGCITFIREYFGVKRIGSTGLKRMSEEKDLTDRQREIIYGTLMGDGMKFANGIMVRHCFDQKQYCDFLYSELRDLCGNNSYRIDTSYDDRYDTKNIEVSFYTQNHRQIKAICDEFYINGEKRISKFILDKLTDFSLSVWFMDDGSSTVNRVNGVAKNISEAKIFTCSFSDEENKMIASWFSCKYGINPTIRHKYDDKNPYLVFNKQDSDKLREIISPHIVQCMKYKVDEDERIKVYKEKNSEFNLETLPTKSYYLNLSEEKKMEVVESIFSFYRETGFPYIRLDDESIMISYERIMNWKRNHIFCDDDKTIKNNVNSTNIIWHFQPHMFNMSSKGSLTPLAIFNNDILFKEAIDRRLSLGGTCSRSGVRGVLKDFKRNRGVGSMPPAIAKAVFASFDKDLTVLDFCAGFGGRLLGAIASDHVKRYVGIDVIKENCDGLNAMYEKFKPLTKTSVSIFNGPSEEVLDTINETFNMVFTSPPFFDKEMYSYNMNQSFRKYPTYRDWLNNWLMTVVKKSTDKLTRNGKLVIWIGHSDDHNITEDFLISSHNILTLVDVIYFEMPKNVYNSKAGDSYRREKFLVMQRK